jgi:hypothetical protein
MGERQNQPFQLSFSASLRVDFQGSRVTSDGGLVLVGELDERLGFGELIHALGIGEPPTGSDFSDDIGRERKSVGRISRKRTRFEPGEQQKGQT